MSEVIDHVEIRASDLPTSRRMYEPALGELGFAVLDEGEFEGDAYVMFGRGTQRRLRTARGGNHARPRSRHDGRTHRVLCAGHRKR